MPALDTDTRRHILDTAREVVARKGYAAVGLTEVLKRAAVPKGSFYYYFPSKDAFGEALMKSYFEDYLATMDRIIATAGRTGAERLMEYWQRFYDLQCSDGCQGRCLVVKLAGEVADLSEAMRLQLAAGTTSIIDRLERLVADGVADGSLSIDAPARTVAEGLYDSWLGASLLAKVHRTPEALDRAMASTRRQLHL